MSSAAHKPANVNTVQVANTKRRRVVAKPKRAVMRELATEFSPGAFLPAEAAQILFGRSESIKRVQTAARLRSVTNQFGLHYLPRDHGLINDEDAPAHTRPRETLSRLNRSAIYPPLLLPAVKVRAVSLTKVVDLARTLGAQGTPSHQLLDLLVSSGLSWSIAAEVLFAEKIIRQRLDHHTVEITRQARSFWTCFGQGRGRYVALVRTDQTRARRGDCACFEHWQLEALLPNVTLPDHCQRGSYFTTYIYQPEACLDLYSLTGVALTRHPFPAQHNPLSFGRPAPPLSVGC